MRRRPKKKSRRKSNPKFSIGSIIGQELWQKVVLAVLGALLAVLLRDMQLVYELKGKVENIEKMQDKMWRAAYGQEQLPVGPVQPEAVR